jgi:hypothetical protein
MERRDAVKAEYDRLQTELEQHNASIAQLSASISREDLIALALKGV